MDNQLIHFSSWCQNTEYNQPSNSVRPPGLLSILAAILGEKICLLTVDYKINKSPAFVLLWRKDGFLINMGPTGKN